MGDAAISALNSLLRSSSIEDHAEALRLATSAAKAAKPGSADLELAQHSRVVALLKLDRFEDALSAIADGGGALENRCLLERVYALYKVGRLAEADEALAGHLKEGSQVDRGVRHVAAQIAYRAEKFDTAAGIYRELVGEEGGRLAEDNDLKINLLATNAQLEWQGRGDRVPGKDRKPGREDMEAFETGYNAACGCAARGDFARALVLLKRAADLCEASEELSAEEKMVELLPIWIQQVFVLAKLDKDKEAAELQKAIELSDANDSATKAVAQNNAILVQKSENPFVKQRHVQLIQTPEPPNRLFEFQARTLRRNRYTIELQCQKFNGVKSSTSSTLAKGEDRPTAADSAQLGVLGAAAQAELKMGKDALRAILPSLEARPDDVGLLLTVMQLCIQTQNPERALELLETFFKRLELATKPDDADVRFAPGLVALAVGLYRLTGRRRAIRTELRKAAAHWRQRQSRDGVGDTLLRQAGAELLQSSNPADLETAGASFEALVASRPDDKLARAGMVASFATSDFAKAKQYLSGLPSPAQLTAGIDVESLIATGVPHAPAPAPITRTSTKRKRVGETDPAQDAPTTSVTTSRAQQKPARKKRRNNKPRLPKEYDPAVKPDPERWLPLRDRSSYRPKGRKGKKRAAEATQGGLVKDAGEAHETLELVGGAGAVRVEKTSAGSAAAGGGGGRGAAAGGGGGVGGGGGGKKKGKKGKK